MCPSSLLLLWPRDEPGSVTAAHAHGQPASQRAQREAFSVSFLLFFSTTSSSSKDWCSGHIPAVMKESHVSFFQRGAPLKNFCVADVPEAVRRSHPPLPPTPPAESPLMDRWPPFCYGPSACQAGTPRPPLRGPWDPRFDPSWPLRCSVAAETAL